MKLFKKALSCLMAAVILVTAMLTGTVTASAATCTSEFTVNGYLKDNYYYIDIGGISKADYNAAIKKGILYIAMAFGDNDKNYAFANLYKDGVKLDVFRVDEKEVNIDLGGYYSLEPDNKGNYTFTFRMAQSKAKNYINAIKKLKNCVITLGYFDEDEENIRNPYGGEPFALFCSPTWDLSGTKENINNLEISEIGKLTYTGENRKAKVVIKDGSYTLVKGTDYTLSYKNCKNIGKATVTITGKGNYTGTKTLTYKIVPKKTTLSAVKKSSSKVKLSWTAVDGAEKYQIYYSKNGGEYTKLTTVSGSKTSCTVSKLDFEENDYKFKIRSYKEVDDTKYYSSYSKVVTVK